MSRRLLRAVPLFVASCADASGGGAGPDAGRTPSESLDGGARDAGSGGAGDGRDGGEGRGRDASGVNASESELGGDAGAALATGSNDTYGSMQTSAVALGSGSSDVGSETMPSFTIPGCGDGELGELEQCDDGNDDAGDGCSNLCRVELGSKCESEPSVCSPTVCGDGNRDGAEGCDDGNVLPFDGCAPDCATEPVCEPGAGCASACGDGLVVNEPCDDGNTQGGDGCSETCTIESGFTCVSSPNASGTGRMNVRAVHRDFALLQPDFGVASSDNRFGIPDGEPIDLGIAQAYLDVDGKPVFGVAPQYAYIESAASFAEWFRGGIRKVDELTLFDNTAGAYVNRFGENGEQYIYVVEGPDEQLVVGASSQETCETGCRQRATYTLNCDAECAIARDDRASATTQIGLLEAAREQTEDETEIAEIDAEIATLQLQVDTLSDEIAQCETECAAAIELLVPPCVDDCKPCSFSPNRLNWCVGGTYVHADGTPLFFPVDDVAGPTQDLAPAQIPPEFGGLGWPREDVVFGEAVEHNFSFTTEVRHWFRYNPDHTLNLVFMSDDDAFVFINGKLAVDLGGLHVPTQSAVTLGPPTASDFGLEPGKVYEIAVFKAERKIGGSTFLLTLPPFAATASLCLPE